MDVEKAKAGGWVGYIEVVVVRLAPDPSFMTKPIVPKLGKMFCQHHFKPVASASRPYGYSDVGSSRNTTQVIINE